MGQWNPNNGRRQLPRRQKRFVNLGSAADVKAAMQALQGANAKLVGEIESLQKQRRSALIAIAAFVSVLGEEHDGVNVYTLAKATVSQLTGAEHVHLKGEDGTIVVTVRQATPEERQKHLGGRSLIILPPGASRN